MVSLIINVFFSSGIFLVIIWKFFREAIKNAYVRVVLLKNYTISIKIFVILNSIIY